MISITLEEVFFVHRFYRSLHASSLYILYTTVVVSNYVASASSMGSILYLHYVFYAVTNGWIGGRLLS